MDLAENTDKSKKSIDITKLTGIERRNANLIPAKPGEVRNRNGRPKKVKCIPDILRRIGMEKVDTPLGKHTKLDLIMRKVYKFAMEGRPWAVQFIAERTEGKVPLVMKADKGSAPLCIVLDPEALGEGINDPEEARFDEAKDITSESETIEKADAGVDQPTQ